MMAKKRVYKKGEPGSEYDSYQGTEEQKKNRAMRNKARREAEADGRVRKGDGKEVDHLRPLSKSGSADKSNTRVVSMEANRKKYDKAAPTKKAAPKKKGTK